MKTKLFPIVTLSVIATMVAPVVTSCSCSDNDTAILNHFVPMDPKWDIPFLMNKEPLRYVKDKEYTVESDLSKWTGDTYADKHWELFTIISAKYQGQEGRYSISLKSHEAKIGLTNLNFVENPISPLEVNEFSYVEKGNTHLFGGVGALTPESKISFRIIINHSVIEEFDLQNPKVYFGLTFAENE